MASILGVFGRRFSLHSKPFLTQSLRQVASQEAHGHGEAEAHLWKKLFLFIAVPAMAFCTYNGFFSAEAREGHARPEFIPYSHLRTRAKPFPWGDGNHSLFHSHNNPLPEGYEDDEEHGQ